MACLAGGLCVSVVCMRKPKFIADLPVSAYKPTTHQDAVEAVPTSLMTAQTNNTDQETLWLTTDISTFPPSGENLAALESRLTIT